MYQYYDILQFKMAFNRITITQYNDMIYITMRSHYHYRTHTTQLIYHAEAIHVFGFTFVDKNISTHDVTVT